MSKAKSSDKRPRPERAGVKGRSRLTSEATRQSVDGDGAGIGEVYLDTFGPPALASTTETYMLVYASVRAILEGNAVNMAPAAAEAARDAAASHVEQTLATSGGQSNE